jgi:hypothetical protein
VHLVCRDDDNPPLAELSGVLHGIERATESSSPTRDRPVRIRLGEGSVWLWPDRFVASNRIGSSDALEVIMGDAILLIGPSPGSWID